jgi:hypothetical protein
LHVPLDRVLAVTWRNFATLFLIVALVTVPLHVARTFVYRKVLVVREFEPDIEAFQEGREVRGIGPEDLDAARRSLWIVTVIEILLIPLAVGAVRRALMVGDVHDHPPGVLDAWTHSASALFSREGGRSPSVGAIAGGAAIGLLAGALLERIGLILSEPVPLYLAFAPIGVTEGASRAVGAIFFLVPLALLGSGPKVISHGSRPNR